ncbi:MAG TPA: hypothetical protein VHG29_08845 [Novosphingobium sp.]|nr:hypothetical protein [Novosphingobium sp.]
MTEYFLRRFVDDAAVRHVGEGLLACTLPRAEWTHEAHLAACLWLITERPDIDPERELPDVIRSYNVSVGGVNDDTQGYHEMLTQLYICGVRGFAADCDKGGLAERVNALLASEMGPRDWPLRFYSHERLFSVAARRAWIAPDLEEL